MTRNAKTCLVTTPLWSVAYSLSFFYLSLYFRACGVDDAQLGSLVTVGAVVAILFSFLAAFFVDRMGRRLSTLCFDLLGSALPLFLYFLDGGFVVALFGTVLANTVKVMNVGFSLLMTEDADDAERATAFNVFNIVYIAAGLLVPLAGSFVGRLGVIVAERWFLSLSALVIAATAIARYRFTDETAMGRSMRERAVAAHSDQTGAGRGGVSFNLGALVSPYVSAIAFLRRSRRAAGVTAANILFYVFYSVGTVASYYFAPFFADVLGLDPSSVGLLGAIFSGGTLIAMLALDPWLLASLGPGGCSLAGAILTLFSFLPLVFLGSGVRGFVFVIVGVASLGYGMLKSGIDAALSTCFGEEGKGVEAGEARSGVYAITNLASSALVAGFGVFAGRFYSSAPRLVPVLSVLLLVGVVASLAPTGIGGRAQSGRARLRS